jgi:hypothetical protein
MVVTLLATIRPGTEPSDGKETGDLVDGVKANIGYVTRHPSVAFGSAIYSSWQYLSTIPDFPACYVFCL